jgi:hypothetical protein
MKCIKAIMNINREMIKETIMKMQNIIRISSPSNFIHQKESISIAIRNLTKQHSPSHLIKIVQK